jgi:hypothetical protein
MCPRLSHAYIGTFSAMRNMRSEAMNLCAVAIVVSWEMKVAAIPFSRFLTDPG